MECKDKNILSGSTCKSLIISAEGSECVDQKDRLLENNRSYYITHWQANESEVRSLLWDANKFHKMNWHLMNLLVFELVFT